MTRIKTTILLISTAALLLSLPVAILAASSSVTAGAFASYPVSVRGAGMGGVYAAVVENLGGAYHNPARLGFTDSRSTGISYADMSGLGLVRNIYLEYVQPDKGYGAAGLYWNWRGTDVEGPGGEGELGYAENTVSYGLGKRFGQYFAVGAALKGYFISTDIDDAGGKGGALDLAVFVRPDPWTTVALVVRNAISRVEWDTGLGDKLPLEIELGATYLIIDGLLGAAELRFEQGHFNSFALGVEYVLMPELATARGGLTHRFDRTYPSFGLGFTPGAFRIDYAAEIDAGGSGLGTTHRLGMSIDF
ncbi:MAG: hypothetical protein FVQ81_05170 [Candidatus Glassbacteria bacterium]|nr:hypothetical protein [Candidatus Glassbacteria bacterium]